MYNPWSGHRVSGSWEDHRSYSYGGTDWPLAYNTPLRAVASGTLSNQGWVGTAGRRATLRFDSPVKRVTAPSRSPMYGGSIPYYEHNCDMVAFVYQHAAGYLASGHYTQGELVGFSGASANGSNWGGAAHLHGHGLCAHGARVDFMKFQGSSPSGGEPTPIPIPLPETIGLLLMPNISIVRNAEIPKQQIAVGPRGRVTLDIQTSDLLNRWLLWLQKDADESKAGVMSIAEMDILISKVLSKIA